MNQKDRERIRRLVDLLDGVPFANMGSGGRTAALYGLVGFDRDMRAFRPFFRKVLQGILMENIEGLEEGWDYHDPDRILDTLETWVEQRKAEGWQNADEYSVWRLWKQRQDQ